MKLVTLYERIIREGEAEACLAKFGNELFDPQLSNDSNVEDNTDTEDRYLDLIDDFTIDSHGKKLRPDFITAMKTLKKCVVAYPDVLHPDGAAYRGENLTFRDLLDQYEDISDDLKEGGTFTIVYKSKSPIQSWTANEDAAMDFAKVSPFLLHKINTFKKVRSNPEQLAKFTQQMIDHLDDLSVPIVITLNTSSDDFLFKAKHFRRLSAHEYEDELLRVSTQPTKVTGEIIPQLLQSVYHMLTAIKRFTNQN